jgi:hypothetical protein
VALQRSRRDVADVATACKRLELQIAALERHAGQPEDPGRKVTGQGWGSTAEELAELRRQHADLQAKQERAATVSRRLMAEINAFRTGTEATKAAYTAAEDAAKTVWHRWQSRAPVVPPKDRDQPTTANGCTLRTAASVASRLPQQRIVTRS